MVDEKHRYPVQLRVERVETLTPDMVRVVLGGPNFATYADRHNDFTDCYVKLVFLNPEFDYPEPLDLVHIKSSMPLEARPVLRTYTIRWFDRAAGEFAIDFVIQGEEGYAGPWARKAKTGDEIYVRGPGGAYRPDPSADAHLLVGDETSLPAIAAALEAMPAEARVTTYIEIDTPQDQVEIDSKPEHHVHWLYRGDQPRGTTTLLADTVKASPWPEGRVQAFVHGEAGLMKSLRSYLLNDRSVARDDLSISGYWRAGNTEESFRQWKAQQKPD